MRVIQLIYGDTTPLIDRCMSSVKRYYPCVDIIRFEKSSNPIKESDNLRFDILSNTDDCLYLDWDIELSGELSLNSNSICAGCYKNIPDYYILYSKDKSNWKKVEDKRKSMCVLKDTFGWMRKVLRELKSDIYSITDNYVHHRISGINGYGKYI